MKHRVEYFIVALKSSFPFIWARAPFEFLNRMQLDVLYEHLETLVLLLCTVNLITFFIYIHALSSYQALMIIISWWLNVFYIIYFRFTIVPHVLRLADADIQEGINHPFINLDIHSHDAVIRIFLHHWIIAFKLTSYALVFCGICMVPIMWALLTSSPILLVIFNTLNVLSLLFQHIYMCIEYKIQSSTNPRLMLDFFGSRCYMMMLVILPSSFLCLATCIFCGITM